MRTTRDVQKMLKERGLGYSRDSLYRYVRENGFPAPTRKGVKAYWSPKRLERWDTLRKIAPAHIVSWAKAHEGDFWQDAVRDWSKITGHNMDHELGVTRFVIHELNTGQTLWHIPTPPTWRDRVERWRYRFDKRRREFLHWVMRKVG